MKLIPVALIAVLLAGNAAAQQIGAVDLRNPKPFKSTPMAIPRCPQITPGIIADGGPIPDGKVRKITLRVTGLSQNEVREGGYVDATISMQNTGDVTFEIPWSADPDTVWAGTSHERTAWSLGEFSVRLTDSSGHHFQLKTVSGDLYGSKQAPQSFIAVRPGQWVAATIQFELADEFSFNSEPIADGAAKLAVEWDRTDLVWSVTPKCSQTRFYGHYSGYYQLEEPSTTIIIRQPLQ